VAEDLLPGADDDLIPADPGDDAQGAAAPDAAMTGADTPPAGEETFFDPAQLAPELQAQWKSMQASFTRARQKDRADARQSSDKAALVDKFWNDRAYALQVVQQIAPQLGLTLTPQGTPQGQPGGNPGAVPTSTEGITALLTAKLGPDLAFLAPALAPAIEHVVTQQTRAAVQPLEQRAQAYTQAQRQQQEDALMAELDTEHPGWEEQYGAQMKELDAFLASDTLTHPTFGSKYSVYLKLLNPSAAKVEAIRGMQRAAGNRVGTGRVGRPAASNVIDQIRQANLKDGWNAAWDLAIKNVDSLADELGR
jgi:hypothetical protein